MFTVRPGGSGQFAIEGGQGNLVALAHLRSRAIRRGVHDPVHVQIQSGFVPAFEVTDAELVRAGVRLDGFRKDTAEVVKLGLELFAKGYEPAADVLRPLLALEDQVEDAIAARDDVRANELLDSARDDTSGTFDQWSENRQARIERLPTDARAELDAFRRRCEQLAKPSLVDVMVTRVRAVGRQARPRERRASGGQRNDRSSPRRSADPDGDDPDPPSGGPV
jgi:hypothetical protein